MMKPVLMPEPNNIRFFSGHAALDRLGGAEVSAGALAAYPAVLDALNRALGAGLHLGENDGPGCKAFQIRLIEKADLRSVEDFFNIRLDPDALKAESYFLHIAPEGIVLAAKDARGFLYAAQTVGQLVSNIEGNSIDIKNCMIFDYPHTALRGAHIYLPARENIGFCKEYIRELARLKYNRIYFEVSAMEYKRHPEINEAWVEYARDMNEFPEKAKRYQGGSHSPERPWYKDSIHIENGGGGVLLQDEVRDIVRFCKELLLDVVPEVQSLSHCDYLVIPHGEIAENPDDPYPDAYCPSNPKSYELLFDVIDEVLDVFEPESVHMGHDEWYSVALCPACRGKDAAELLAADVTKIRDYLHSKGVRVEMMSDKLLDGHTPDARGQGGAYRIVEDYETSEIYNRMPATHRAVGMIPKDIVMQHWHWGLEPYGHRQYAAHGLATSFQNFGAFGSYPRDWAETSREPGVLGGVLTHWDLVEERTMAWDMYLTGTVFCSQLLWNGHCSQAGLYETRDRAFEYLPRCRQALGGTALPSISLGRKETTSVSLRHEKKEHFYMDSACVELRNFFDTAIGQRRTGKYGRGVSVSIMEKAQSFRIAVVNGKADSLVFKHTTSLSLPYHSADHGYKPEDYRLGVYTVLYADGAAASIDLEYGYNIGYLNANWGFDLASVDGSVSSDIHLFQTAYAARPELITQNYREQATVYNFEWVNPEPGKEISEISLSLASMHVPYSVFVHGILGIRLQP